MTVHHTAVVEAGAELAEGVEIGPWCLVGPRVKLHRGVRLHAHVVIEGETEVGEDCEIYPFAMLGAPPQHAGHKRGDPSRLVLGARNLVREHVTMHGGSVLGAGVTTVGNDGAFYVGAHIGHDCIVGDHVVMTNQAMLGGHAVLGDHVIMGGLSAVQQRCRVGRHAFIGGLAGVNYDVTPFAMVWGNHARLEGLNLVGLKRRGFSRESILALRALYRSLFGCAEGLPFRERVAAAASSFAGQPEAMEVIEFIRSEPTRPLILPARAPPKEE